MVSSKNRVVAKSMEVLVNYLVALELGIPEILACPFYRDFVDLRKMVKLEELYDNQTLGRCIHLIETKADAFDPDDLVLCDDTIDHEFSGGPDCRVGILLRQLAPMHEDRRRSLTRLLIRVEGREHFRQILDMLFRFKIRAIRTLKMQKGEAEGYLVLVSDNHTPAVIASLHQSAWADVFYPVYASNYGVWIQWGVRYDFDDPVHHRLLQEREDHTVLIKRNGDKLHLPAGLNDFTPLSRVIDLHFAARSQVNTAEPSPFEAPELAFTLSLHRDSERSMRRQELERLRRKEREIRERIEWLRDIEAIYDEDKQFRVMFYPFGTDQRDPVFPHFFFRHHSMRKLRRMKFYHGAIGSLGEGTLVGGSSFLDRKYDGSGHEILQRFYPVKGMVFQSNPHWLKAAGLRILTPAGFDLYPYLDMDDTDRQTIVAAFIQTAVWGVSQTDPDGMGRKILSDKELDARGKAIMARPEEYLFFVLSPEPIAAVHGQKPRLEGLVIHEADFNGFEFRFQNLGIHFAANDEERNVVRANLEETLVDNVLGSFNHSAQRLRTSLEEAFDEERARLKERIEEFNKFVKGTEARLKKRRKKLRKTMAKVEEREEKITAYDQYLKARAGELSALMKENNQGLDQFFREVSHMAASVAKDLNTVFANQIDETEDQLEALQQFKKRAEQTDEAVVEMVATQKMTSAAYEEIKALEKTLSTAFNAAQWKYLGMQENLRKTWLLADACRGLEALMSQVEHYIRTQHKAGQKASLSRTARDSDGVWAWLRAEHERMGELVADGAVTGAATQRVIDRIGALKKPLQAVLLEIQNAAGALKRQQAQARDDKDLYRSIDAGLKSLYKIMYQR